MIRPALHSDCRELAILHTASWREAYEEILPRDYLDSLNVEVRAHSWEKILESKESKVYLHLVGNRMLGFAATCPSRDKDSLESQGEVSAIYYRKDAWGKGLASELMEIALRELQNGGFSQVTLWVLRGNFRAQAFYRKHGFVPDGNERMFERASVVFDEIRMVRS